MQEGDPCRIKLDRNVQCNIAKIRSLQFLSLYAEVSYSRTDR